MLEIFLRYAGFIYRMNISYLHLWL